MTVARNTIIDYVCQGIMAVMAVVQSMILIHAIGKTNLGIMLFIIYVNSFCSVTFNFSLSNSNIYFAGKDRRRTGQLNAISAILTLIIGLVLLLTLQWVGPWIMEHYKEKDISQIPTIYLTIAIALLPIRLYYSAWIGLMVGLGAVVKLAVYNTIYAFIETTTYIVVLVVLRKGTQGFVTAWVVVNICHLIAMWLLLRTEERVWARFSMRDMVNVLSFSMRAYVGNFALSLIGSIHGYFSTWLQGADGMTIYSRANNVFVYSNMGVDALERATYKHVTAAVQEEAARIVQRMVRNILLLSTTGVIVMIPFSYLILLILTAWTVDVAKAGTAPLQILLIGLPFFSCNKALAMYVTGQLGKPQISSLITWFSVPVAGLLLYLLVPRYGLPGLAAATSGTYIFLFVAFLSYFISKTGLSNPRDYLIPKPEDIRSFQRVFRSISRFLTRNKSAA